MVSTATTVDTGHNDMIHDAQLDYYGKRLATASSDRTVRVFDGINGQQELLAELTGHEGPVWEVAWAHPKFGNILASCSYDRRVIFWKETSGQWSKLHEVMLHESSVNSISWAPHEYGPQLACASSDGFISIITAKGDGSWETQKFKAHQVGCNAVSWAPAVPAGALGQVGNVSPAMKRLVTGGCDNLVKVWSFAVNENAWVVSATLEGHSDWVRDVAWAPSIGLSSNIIASCSQDCTAIMWTQDDPSSAWQPKALPKFSDVLWRVSWSVTGNILAVSGGDNKVTMWKESIEGSWTMLTEVDEGQNMGGGQ